MSGIDIEIEMNKLGDLPLYPPRRRFIDLVPTFIMSWVRRKFGWPKATPREQWAVTSLMLRVAYNSQRVAAAIEEMPKAYFKHEGTAPESVNFDPEADPFRFN